MKLTTLTFSLLLIFSTAIWSQELLTPSSSAVKDKAIFSDSSNRIVGNGFFPISYKEAKLQLPKKDTSGNWVMRKLFSEHFIQQSGKDFFFAADPLLNLSIGQEQLQNSTDYLFQNTRGAQAFGQIKDKFSFYTAFYENQARFVDYQNAYFVDRGELYPDNLGAYASQNAVVPGGGRTKPFKTNGYDYSSAVSYIRFTPIDKLAVQFGNAPRFYGWGYRSMLLSDNSYNYTNLTIDWEIFKGLNYTFMRGKQLNLTRKVYTDLVEAPYERKGIGVHYLSFQPVPSVVIGLFESTVYLRDEATSSQSVNPHFYNPIIGVNTVANGAENGDTKNIFGVNIAWQFHAQHMLYAQAVSDDITKKEYGLQLGYRTGNPFNIDNLHLQLEANIATSNLYAANNERMAYTHFNLPLAHTLGNGFTEIIGRASYQWKGVFIDGKVVYYAADQPIDNKTRLFESKQFISLKNETRVMNTNIEVGYEINPATQLRVFVNVNYRTSASELGDDLNYGAVSIGIRSALTNQYFDF